MDEEIMGSYDRRNTPHKKDAIARTMTNWWAALRVVNPHSLYTIMGRDVRPPVEEDRTDLSIEEKRPDFLGRSAEPSKLLFFN